jgi:hypothetical protein
VLYLANASSPRVRDAMLAGELGMMCTPAEGRTPLPGVAWAADNGCFGKGYPGDQEWLTWLQRHSHAADRCLFAVAPDVFNPELGDDIAAASIARSRPFLPIIRAMGYPAALVAQNGAQNEDLPWDEFDVLFIGGDTEWKLSPHANRLAYEAQQRGKRIHMGRVNSARRWSIAEFFGCDTCDGTFLAFGPDTNLDRQRRWAVPNLWTAAS